MGILIVGFITAIIAIWKIKGRPYWTAIVKSLLVVLALFISIMVSKYQSQESILFEETYKALTFSLLILMLVLPFMLFLVKLKEILRKDLDNPQ